MILRRGDFKGRRWGGSNGRRCDQVFVLIINMINRVISQVNAIDNDTAEDES